VQHSGTYIAAAPPATHSLTSLRSLVTLILQKSLMTEKDEKLQKFNQKLAAIRAGLAKELGKVSKTCC
jgi:hypothetical protein